MGLPKKYPRDCKRKWDDPKWMSSNRKTEAKRTLDTLIETLPQAKDLGDRNVRLESIRRLARKAGVDPSTLGVL